jgi:hypothetical protein
MKLWTSNPCARTDQWYVWDMYEPLPPQPVFIGTMENAGMVGIFTKDGGAVMSSEGKGMDPKIQAVIDAAKLYEKWARDTGDYPHDEQGCEAHDAILAAVRALGQ